MGREEKGKILYGYGAHMSALSFYVRPRDRGRTTYHHGLPSFKQKRFIRESIFQNNLLCTIAASQLCLLGFANLGVSENSYHVVSLIDSCQWSMAMRPTRYFHSSVFRWCKMDDTLTHITFTPPMYTHMCVFLHTLRSYRRHPRLDRVRARVFSHLMRMHVCF